MKTENYATRHGNFIYINQDFIKRKERKGKNYERNIGIFKER